MEEIESLYSTRPPRGQRLESRPLRHYHYGARIYVISAWDVTKTGATQKDLVITRCPKLALDRRIGGPLDAASACMMKHPREQMRDSEAFVALERFITNKME